MRYNCVIYNLATNLPMKYVSTIYNFAMRYISDIHVYNFPRLHITDVNEFKKRELFSY